VLHSKTKHIEVRYHFLRDNVEKEKIALIHVPTHDQVADIFTKPLDQATFTRLSGGSLVCVSFLELGVRELLCSICVVSFVHFLHFAWHM
jgi:hypothetical protein